MAGSSDSGTTSEHENGAWRWILLILTAAFLVLLFYRGLLDPDEGRYAEIPREMVSSGKWMEMRLFGVRYYEKPPLTYWITALPLRVFGPHDWAARLPLFPAGLALAALGFLIASRGWGRARGLPATLIAVTMFGLFFAMSMPIPDSYLTLWFAALCILLFYAFRPDAGARRRWACLLAAAVFAFLGTMTKGLIAIVLPAGVLFLWLLWERRLKSLRTLPVFAAAALYLALMVPTVWRLEKYNPGFTQYFFVDEHLSRFIGTRRDQLHGKPPWFFLTTLPILLIPWTFFIFRTVRTLVVQRVLSRDSVSRFLLVWAAVVIVFFSASTGKLMSYIMPSLLPLGLLVGRWGVAEPLDGSRTDRRLWMLGFLPLPLVNILLPLIWALGWLGFFPEDLAVPDPLSAAPLALTAVAAVMLTLRRSTTVAGAAMLAALFYMGLAFLLSPLAGTDMNARLFRNSKPLFQELAARMEPEDRLVMMYRYKPSAVFYTQRIPVLHGVVNELCYGMDAEPGRLTYTKTNGELTDLMAGSTGRWYGVMADEDADRLLREGLGTKTTVLISSCEMRVLEFPAPQP